MLSNIRKKNKKQDFPSEWIFVILEENKTTRYYLEMRFEVTQK